MGGGGGTLAEAAMLYLSPPLLDHLRAFLWHDRHAQAAALGALSRDDLAVRGWVGVQERVCGSKDRRRKGSATPTSTGKARSERELTSQSRTPKEYTSLSCEGSSPSSTSGAILRQVGGGWRWFWGWGWLWVCGMRLVRAS